MNENTYTSQEVAELVDCNLQTLREQVKADIAQGRNSQNFNAFQVDNTLRFPKKWIDKKLGIGPVIEVPDWFAQLMTRLGMAVEVQDGSENV